MAWILRLSIVVFMWATVAISKPEYSCFSGMDLIHKTTSGARVGKQKKVKERTTFLLRGGASLMPTYATEDLTELVGKENEFFPSLAVDFHWGVAFFQRRISLATGVSTYVLAHDFSRQQVDTDTYICYDWQENVTATESYSIRPIADLKISPSYSPGRFRFYHVFGLHVYSVLNKRSTESVLLRRADQTVLLRGEESETTENLSVNWFIGGGFGVKTAVGEIGLEANGELDALRGKVYWKYTIYP